MWRRALLTSIAILGLQSADLHATTIFGTQESTTQGGLGKSYDGVDDRSFEFVFELGSDTSADQLIFETGGQTKGLNVRWNGSVNAAQFQVQIKNYGSANTSSPPSLNFTTTAYDLGSSDSDIQLFLVLDRGTESKLYVTPTVGPNAGTFQKTTDIDPVDWHGSNNAGLGTFEGVVGGSDDDAGETYANFGGTFSRFEDYSGVAATDDNVSMNFQTRVIPEPSSFIIAALGIFSVLAAVRFRR